MFKKLFAGAYEKVKELYRDIMFNGKNEDAREAYVRQCNMSYSGVIPFDVESEKYEVEARKYNPEYAQSSKAKDLFKGPFMTRNKAEELLVSGKGTPKERKVAEIAVKGNIDSIKRIKSIGEMDSPRRGGFER